MTKKLIYKFENFYLDLGRQSFFHLNDEIKLEPRVFDVLHLLLQRPNELITKNDFFEYVWEGKVVSDWALSRAIKVLRKTLSQYIDETIVKTLYGKGYLFVSEVRIVEQKTTTKNINDPAKSTESPLQEGDLEVGPNSGEPTGSIEAEPQMSKKNYLALTLLSVLGLFILYLYFSSPKNKEDTNHSKIKSIVVLPITNISGSAEAEYLASGLTDVIIGQLAKVSSIRVISKTSAAFYKNKKMTTREIANELNVETVLEGSIFPDKENINLSLRLIDAESEVLLWSLDEQESAQDIYSLFKFSARKVADRIASRTPTEKQQLSTSEYINRETFELYLRATYILNRRKGKDLHKAEALLLLAIEKDPYFAEAYAKLATVYIIMSSYNTEKRIDWFRLAKEYVDDSLVLDSNSSFTWTNLGLIELGYNYDLSEAKKAYEKAISTNPNDVEAQRYLAELFAIQSNYKKALKLLEKTRQKDSMNPLLIAVWGSVLMMDKQYDKALEKFDLAKNLGGQMLWVDRDIAYVHQWQGNDKLSLEFRYREMKGLGYFEKGDEDFIEATKKNGILGFWQWRIPIFLDKWREGKLHGCYLAEAYAGIKDYKKMLQWFNTGLEQKSETCFQLVKRSPEFYRFKNEPKFKSLLSKYGIAI